MHQLLTVRPGSPPDYLATVVEHQAPLWREYGHQPTGIYEVLGNQHEVVVVWEREAATFVTGGDTHLTTPLPGTVYGPADWDEASLDDWLPVEA